MAFVICVDPIVSKYETFAKVENIHPSFQDITYIIKSFEQDKRARQFYLYHIICSHMRFCVCCSYINDIMSMLL